MSSRVPPIDMDPPHPFYIKLIMIYSLIHVLGMIKLKNQHRKRRNVYNSIVQPTYVDYRQDASDFVQESSYGGIDLPSDEFYQINTLSSRHPPHSRPDSPSKPPFRPNLNNQDPKVLQKV